MTRTGERIALMVVDLQIGMMDGVKFPPLVEHQALLAKAKALIAWARGGGHLVVFIRHDGQSAEALAPGAPGWPLHPALGRREDESVFSKSVGDAFSEPQLAGWLRNRGVERLVLLGAQTDQCVRETVNGALANGFAVTVASDAHGTWDWAGETAAQIIKRHNALYAAAGASVMTTDEIAARH
jgi:nicotinamidase-related amidase